MKLPPLNTVDIQEIIPHRYPILLVDRVLEFHDGEKIIGTKCVSSNEPFFQGHFPDQPIMPGVLMLEALAQLGVIYSILAKDGANRDSLHVFAGADNVKFRRQVIPGDVLTLEMRELKRRRGIWKMEGIARVGEEVAMEGILTAAEASGI